MKTSILLLCVFLGVSAPLTAALKDDLSLTGGERIVIAGDSISNAHKYSAYLQAWLHLTYPDLDLHVQEAARGGTSSSGWATVDTTPPAESQYERLAYPLSPDVVFLMLGHNDGSDVSAHATNTQTIIDTWIEGMDGAIPVLLGAHPTSSTDGKPVLGQFNDNYRTIAEAATPDYLYADIWDELVTEWVTDFNASTGYVGGADSIHPGTGGHIAITRAALKLIGAETLVSSATINAATNSEATSSGATLSALAMTATGGSFSRLDARLPWAIDEAGRADAVALYPDVAGWQEYSLTVMGLVSGTYSIYCDGVLIGAATNAELAAGWNMADLTVGPVFDQCQEVLGLVRDMQGVDRTTLSRTGPPYTGMESVKSQATASYQNGDLRGSAYLAAMAAKVAALDAFDAAIHTAAQPVTRTYTLTRQGAAAYVVPRGLPQPMWGVFDPINTEPPSQPAGWPSAEAIGYYYIDSSHGSATDTGNDYGYPDQPRLTIPETTYSAGAYVEIHGGPYVHSAADAELDLVASGTEANPVWFLFGEGVSEAEVRGAVEFSGTYAIIDGLHLTYDTVNGQAPRLGFGGDTDTGSYLCFRNSTVTGDGTYHAGFGSAVGGNGTLGDELTNVVIYNVTVSDLDDWEYATDVDEDDNHAFLPGLYTEDWWFLNCTAYHNSGDGMQISGNNASGEARSQRIYLGDCTFYENGENAVDIKSSLDIVMSGCEFYGYENSGGSDGTAVVVQQEGGDGSDNVWLIFSHVHDSVVGFRAEETVTNIYAIGNLFVDIDRSHPTANYPAVVKSRTDTAELNLIDNTIVGLGLDGFEWDNDPGIVVHGNIFSGKASADYWLKSDSNAAGDLADYNLYDSGDVFRIKWQNVDYTDLATYAAAESVEANSLEGDPVFVDAAGGDYTLGSGSDAIDANTEHAAYTTFFTRYGLSIEYDYAGVARSGDWEIGAYEYTGSGSIGGSITATSLSVTTLSVRN